VATRRKKLALGCSGIALLLILSLAWLHHLLFDRTPGEYLEVDGVKIYYTSEGNAQGDAVILIHGLAAHADINWRRPGINALLAPDFRVIAMDLRGHGLSDRPHDAGAYGLKTVEDITRLMEHLNIEKAHLAGYSLGGFLALKYATLHPDRVLSLAICASGWKDPESREPIRSPYRDDPETRLPPDEKQYNRMMRDTQVRAAGTLEASVIPGLPDAYNPVEWGRDYFGDRVVDRVAIKALKRGLGAFVVTREQLAALEVPTLCLMGTRDGLKPYAMDLKAAMPQAELGLIDGADHITTVMYGEFQRRLQSFFLTHKVARP